MSRGLVRTTSFRLGREHFGTVYVYRAGKRFLDEWHRLEHAHTGAGSEYRQLPYKSLETVLRVLSGDFVGMWISRREPTVIVSRTRLTVALRQSALLAWEYAIWPQSAKGALADLADDLVEQEIDVWDVIIRRQGSCPSADQWVWNVATWEIAHRLAGAPLILDEGRSAALRLDTDAGLLTWDCLVTRPGRLGGLTAMHRIEPRLISMPGLGDPVISFESSLTRLADRWGGVKTAWIDRGPQSPVLTVETRTRKTDAGFETFFTDGAADVLRRLDLAQVADPESIDLRTTALVRARVASAPARFPIGTGPGQMFHDAVALHVRQQVPDLEPVELVRARHSLASPNQCPLTHDNLDEAAQELRGKRLRIVALYATDDTRARMIKAVRPVMPFLPRRIKDGETYQGGGLEFVCASPPDSELYLCRNGDGAAVRRWAKQMATPWSDNVTTGALIETTTEQERKSDGDDPKFVVRDVLARLGIVSQFLSPSSTPTPSVDPSEEPTDHAAERAVWDLLRSAGAFPRCFPTVSAVPDGTWLVGIYVVHRKMSASSFNRGFVVSIVAVEAGGRKAKALNPQGKWVPLGDATADFHAATHDLRFEDVVPWIDGALSRLLATSKRSMVIFAEAIGTRRFFTGLRDKGGDALPNVVRTGRAALVRVRSEEVPRPAGIGPWPTGPGPARPRTANALLRLAKEDFPGAYFYINTPRNMQVMGRHRSQTRFSAAEAEPRSLGENWQSLNLTEFLCIDAGPFEAEPLYELSALLCREAPTWEGTLQWPSPCHLAKAVVEDHPGRYLSDSIPAPQRRGGGDQPALQAEPNMSRTAS